MKAFVALLFSLLFSFGMAAVHVKPNMKTFGTAIKGGKAVANEEYTLFEYTGNGVVTEMWFTGVPFDNTARLKIFCDDEVIDVNLYLFHGIGTDEKIESSHEPWGTDEVGHAANSGGLYNTHRIPFQKTLKVTITTTTSGWFWFIIRGVENYPIVVGDLILPTSTYLRVYKNENLVLKPFEFVNLAVVEPSELKGGMLYQVVLSANSTDYNYLEACVRAFIDTNATEPLWLSSGTEDYFLSAFYYNKGVYHLPNSGLSAKADPGFTTSYKYHIRDPVLFTNAFTLKWRCGEKECPNTWPPSENFAEKVIKENDSNPQLASTTVSTYTFVYVWENGM